MKKIRNKKGETLVEVLIATLLISVCFVMLAGSIVSSAKVNAATQKINTNFVKDNNVGKTESVTITHGYNTSRESVTMHESNGYYYYEK